MHRTTGEIFTLFSRYFHAIFTLFSRYFHAIFTLFKRCLNAESRYLNADQRDFNADSRSSRCFNSALPLITTAGSLRWITPGAASISTPIKPQAGYRGTQAAGGGPPLRKVTPAPSPAPSLPSRSLPVAQGTIQWTSIAKPYPNAGPTNSAIGRIPPSGPRCHFFHAV